MQKILIVEDDVDIQDILKNYLIDAGYKAIVSSNGVAGIAMFDDTIDLVNCSARSAAIRCISSTNRPPACIRPIPTG